MIDSPIGDYIHFTYSGYVEKRGAKRPPYFSEYGKSFYKKRRRFENWVNKQKSPITEVLEKETQKTLDILKNFKDKKGNVTADEQVFVETLLDELWMYMDSKYFKVDKMAAASAGLIEAGGYYVGSYTGEGGDHQHKQSNAISGMNNQLQTILNSTLANISEDIKMISNTNNAKKIQGILQQTQVNINNFVNELQKTGKSFKSLDFKESSKLINNMFADLVKAIKNDKELKSIDIENSLNIILDSLEAGMTANQYKGDISEALITVVANRMKDIAGSAIQKAMVTGQQRSSRGLDTSYFVDLSSSQWQKALGDKKFKAPYENFVVSANAVQDKVDVKIELSTGKSAYISAKNYSMKSLARGVTNRSASFLTLIQNENQDDFINHYLNLNAIKGKSLQIDKEVINSFLRKIIAAKLITGYNTTTGGNGQVMDTANIFTVFNSDTYQVKYYDMGKILKGIFNSGSYNSINIPINFFDSNDWSIQGAEDRIIKLIKRLNVSTSFTLKEEDYTK